jgi:hypothetical protein
LTYTVSRLPGLKVGDICHVNGEGLDKFAIKGMVLFSSDRYGFLLDSGCLEEVAKCFSC